MKIANVNVVIFFQQWFAQLCAKVFPEITRKRRVAELTQELHDLLHSYHPRGISSDNVIAISRELVSLGARETVAEKLSVHIDKFAIMRYAMTEVDPRLAEIYAPSSVEFAKEHMRLCGHHDRAKWARQSTMFAKECYNILGRRPPDFQVFFDNVMEKTDWINR